MTLNPDLEKLLRKYDVDKKINEYLISKNVVSITKFASLADSKMDVAEGICVPAGLDKADRPLCGPVKSAWAEAEALATAALLALT